MAKILSMGLKQFLLLCFSSAFITQLSIFFLYLTTIPHKERISYCDKILLRLLCLDCSCFLFFFRSNFFTKYPLSQLRFNSGSYVCTFSSCSSKLAAPVSKKSVRRGRPLDAAWDHATPVDAKRQRAVCKYCGFISSSGGITHLKAHLAGGDPKGPSKGCPNVPPEVKRAMAESLNRTVKGAKSMQPEEIRRYMKAENDWSPPGSDDYSLNQHRIVKNAQYSHLASGGNSVNDMTMSKQSEMAHVDSYMEVMSSHNACKSSFLSKPTTRVGFI